MSSSNKRHSLHGSADDPSAEVMILADVVGKSSTTLAVVMRDFLEIVSQPIIAGGFAMAHHGFVRATVDIDVLAMDSILSFIKEFESRGYKHESTQLPIGSLDMLTKGNKGVDFIQLKDEHLRASIQTRAVDGTFLDQPVRYVSLEDLILLKTLALSGRKKKMDEADLESLLSKPYDSSYVETWKKKLKIR